jgi:uncharacterized membrane protein YgcG
MLRATKDRGVKRTRAVVPEYLPPKDADVLLSSLIIKDNSKWVSATYVDLAVRHKVKIIEREEGFLKRKAYSLELVSNEGLSVSEKSIVDALFGEKQSVGERHDFALNKSDYGLYKRLRDTRDSASKRADKDGYYHFDEKLKKSMKRLLIAIGLMIPFSNFFGLTMLITGLVIFFTMKPLSQKGRDLLDYLDGLKMYIKVGEEERIRIMQSPDGANKVSIDINDKSSVVKLYERVLPYAVLFGNEKEWVKALGKFYEDQSMQPDWYAGHNGIFNAALFSSSMSRFSSNATSNSYSSPSSSSSGGSGGGGFSGGGGGGGGGGGW